MERTAGQLVERIAARCAAAGLRVGVAESCTAGLVAAALASVPGASAWFRGGVVSYATDVKRALLGVDPELLAGPDGDPERDIPVGTVFLGWSDARGSGAERRRFPGGRDEVRAAARDAALELLLRRAEA